MHVEEGFLLPGEREIGQVFGGGRRTHRHCGIVPRQRGIGLRDRSGHILRHRREREQLVDRVPRRFQRRRSREINLCQRCQNVGLQVVLGDEASIRLGRHVKAVGHGQARVGESGQRSPFAADDVQRRARIRQSQYVFR